MPRIMVLDLETENHSYYGALASPRHPQNYVVAVGQAIDEQPYSGAVTGEYYTSKEASQNWLKIPDDVWLLVAHNAPFEMDWALCTQREEIMRFLARGGRVFCTAYAEYLLSNQQTTYPDLNSTAPKYGGTHKVDAVKVLWEQGYLTSQIDKALLFDEYLLGPGGDIENTRKVFYGQYSQLVARGMWDMVLTRCEGMLFNCFAMDSGLYVNRDIAFAQKGVAEQKLGEIKQRFAAYRTHIPEYVQFKDTSDFHMSAWLFGGPIKYKIQDTWFEEDGVTPKYEKADFYKFADGGLGLVELFNGRPDIAEQWVAAHGPVEKYKSGKNKGQPKVFREDTTEVKKKWYDRTLMLGPLIDLNKMPKDILKEFIHEFTGKRKLADESPVYSTGADCIEMLSKRPEYAEVHAVLKDLLEFAKLDKDLGTYYLREVCDEEGNVTKQSGMLQYLTPESIVYHVLNCTSTVTTRLSATRPNMQNIPRGDTSDVKNMFTSRFDSEVWLKAALACRLIDSALYAECIANIVAGIPNGAIVEADYAAVEVVTLAAFSKDAALVQALLDGTDMHCMRLSKQLGEPYEEVLKKCKDEQHPEHKQYKTRRTHIKPKAFAYQYGATAHGIAFATGCTVEEAQEFIDTEKALFPGVEAFYSDVITPEVERNTTRHREELAPGQWRMYQRGVWRSPAGTCYEFREYPKVKWVDGQRIECMEFKPTQIRNYPIQGESGFFLQGIAGLVARWLISRGFFGGKVWIINQVHDALYFDVHRSVLHEFAVTLKAIMQSIPEYYKQFGYDLGVPFPAEVEAGPSMNDKEKVA